MKLPLSWLKEYVDIDVSAEKLAEKLTMTGQEVESVESSTNFSGVVIGEVLEVKKHPNADKLNVAKVNVGKETLQIVCGAPNLAKGQKVPVALVGAKLDDFEINKASLRGVESFGMICSEKELGLGEDHSGILVLKKDAKVGESFADYIGKDSIIDIKIAANRPDCMSVVGLARETAATLDKKLDLNEIFFKETKESRTEDLAEVVVEDKELCLRYTARVVRNVKVGPSPEWMQKRLIECGIRPINNLVDISNYVMLEFGQPLHIFDLNKIAKDKKKAKIIVRRAKKGEEIVTLDGVSRKLTPEMLLICDPNGPVGIAGVMGGANSEVDENTKDILIEAAAFDKANIRRTSRSLGLRSEAVARFEKGIPLTLPEVGNDRCAQLVAELAKGEVSEGKIDVLSKWIWVQHIGLRVSKVRSFLGIEISDKEIVDILHRLGIEAEKFDIIREAKRHLGKPYKWGASYKTDGTDAFDCGYLVDYVYSLIGKMVGHTAAEIMESSREIDLDELTPGDVLFRNGKWIKANEKERNGVSHVAIYIGEGKIIHAEDHHRVNGEWQEMPEEERKVRIDPLEIITEDPHFIRAGRLVDDLDNYIAVTAPWWRPDLKNEYDLFEEIGRIWGYDKIPSTLPETGATVPEKNFHFELNHEIRKLLASIGLTEILTYSFANKKEVVSVGGSIDEAPKVANPLVSEQEYLRTNLTSHMLKSLAENQFYRDDLKLFELGRTYSLTKGNGLPKEERRLVIGLTDGVSWPINYGAYNPFYALKGIMERLFADLNLAGQKIELKRAENTIYASGKSAEIYINNENIGSLGIVNAKTANLFGLKKTAAVLEISIDKIGKWAKQTRVFEDFSKFPSIVRDVSAVFATTAEAGKITAEIRKIDQLVKSADVVDIYTGKPLEKNEKSVSVRIVFQSKEKTLTDTEVDAIMNKINKKIAELGGKIRGGKES